MTNISSSKVYKVEEQPGDGTRYTHIIIPEFEARMFIIASDPLRKGAGVKQVQYVPSKVVDGIWSKLADIPNVDNQASYIAEHVYMGEQPKENPYTYASIIRMCKDIMRYYEGVTVKLNRCGCGGQGVLHRHNGTHTVVCSECSVRTGRSKSEPDAISEWNRAVGGDTV
jgi:hypothetical protein